MKTSHTLHPALYIALALHLLFLVTLGHAAIQVNPQSTYPGVAVSVTLTGTLSSTGLMTLTIDFGDGSTPVSSTYNTAATHSFTANHTYAAAGGYTITGTTTIASLLAGPISFTETTAVRVLNRPTLQQPGGSTATPFPSLAELPRGVVGVEYEHTLDPTPSGRSNRYQVTRGKLPPGLKIDRNGDLVGIPTQKGVFPFTVRVSGSQRATFSQDFTVYVDPGELGLEVDPQTINATGGGITFERVTFSVVHPTVPINETIRSSRGEFLVDGRTIGFNSVPLSINLNSLNPAASETVRIPQSVIRNAQSAGTGKITYRRTFTSRNLNPGSGETRVTMRSPASGELRVVGMRIFFEQNNRPIILVQRNSRDLTGVMELKYNGSGLLKGVWHVDGRIIGRVQKHLNYGKVLILKTPAAPPLPTYSEGSHRLQFVVTEPASAAERIDFPEAIYHVEARRAEIIASIQILTPENKTDLYPSDVHFNWSKTARVARYQIEFFKDDDENPFFTAHAKEEQYQLPEKVLQYKFNTGETYSWRVRGFNNAGELTSESSIYRFTLTEQSAVIPGQTIFIVDNNEGGLDTINRIVSQYGLTLIEQTELNSINRILVLCSTSSKGQKLVAELGKEKGIYLAQPNFIFSTLGTDDPLRSQQTIHRLLDLERIQQQVSGKNVVVAVIDTGVDLEHRDLSNRITDHANFVTGSDYRAEIHGTAIGGIIAGSRNDFGIRGIAPDASLAAYRACEQISATASEGVCSSVSIAKAINEAVSTGVHIANLSVGASHRDQLISDLIEIGHDKGIAFTAPVGNDPQAAEISFPASHPLVVSVAGLGEHHAGFPNKLIAAKADAVAPAQNIFTSIPDNKHNFLDGTSYSAAIIAGIIALSIEQNGSYANDFPRFDDNTIWQNQVAAYINK